MQIFDKIIIGAGISGLVLGHRLKKLNQNNFLILEKSKSVGGRIATRRISSDLSNKEIVSTFDHGAQFVGSDLFPYLEKNQIEFWTRSRQKDLFASPKGLTQMAKLFALELPLKFNEKVMQICKIKLQNELIYELICESQEKYYCKELFISAPLPQALELLNRSQIKYSGILNQVIYAKALVGLIEINKPINLLSKLNYYDRLNESVFSLAHQTSKILNQKSCWTLTLTPELSESYFDQSEDIQKELILKKFIESLSQILQIPLMDFEKSVAISHAEVKKWRYSHPEKSLSEINSKNIYYDKLSDESIILIGDGFRGGSIIKAITSAEMVPI